MHRRFVRGGIVALALALSVSACTQASNVPAGGAASLAAKDGPEVPYKLGMFEAGGQTFVGLVLRDAQVVDLARANAAFEKGNTGTAALAAPADVNALISAYDAWKPRLVALAKAVPAEGAPAFVFAMETVRPLPPVRPGLILNAGGNYTEHTAGIAAQAARTGARPEAAVTAVSAPGIWERTPDDPRPENPYIFLKSPTVMSGANDPIVIPRGRTNIDFECEFAIVIGKRSKYVPIAAAPDHVFGYTIQIDVSDRGGRGDRKMGGSDWLLQKSHDTFGPFGPVVVPKEYLTDPLNTRHTFTLNGEVMQDSNTNRMAHNFYELLHYASNILTLSPGDIISGGSPAGTNIERAEPRWMRAGDKAVCSVEGIGTQTHTVVAETASAGFP